MNTDPRFELGWSDDQVPPIGELMDGLEAVKAEADALLAKAVDHVDGVISSTARTAGELLGRPAKIVGDGIVAASGVLDALQQPLSTAIGEAVASVQESAAGLPAVQPGHLVCIQDANGRPWPATVFVPTDPSTWPTPTDVPPGWVRQPGQAVMGDEGQWYLPSWHDPARPEDRSADYPQQVFVNRFMEYCPPGTHEGQPSATPLPIPLPPIPLPSPPIPFPIPGSGQGNVGQRNGENAGYPPQFPPPCGDQGTLPEPVPGPQPIPRPAPVPFPTPGPVPTTCPAQPVVCPAPQVVCPQPPEPQEPPPIPLPPDRGLPHSPEGQIQCAVDAFQSVLDEQPPPITEDRKHILRDMVFGGQDGYQSYLNYITTLIGLADPAARIVATVKQALVSVVDTIDGVLVATMDKQGCDSNAYLEHLVQEVFWGWANFVSMGGARRPLQTEQYATNVLCPVEFPGAAEAIQAFLRNDISEETLKLWLAQNNKCWEPFERVVRSSSSRLTAYELLSIWRRGLITDDRLDLELRRIGHLDKSNPAWYRELAKFIPPITDLIRFMVRDTADEELVKRFGLDDLFDRKWSGDVAKWGEWQGVAADTARHYWRAHWQIPSPTQLFAMYHRSRAKDPADPTYTSLEDVQVALGQQDILPFWQSRLLDTTFIIPTRVDARRAFALGAISADQLRSIHVRQGYSNDDADTLVRFAKLQRVQSIKATPNGKSFRYGIISRAAFEDYLRRVGLDFLEIRQVVDEITEEIRRPWLLRCGKALARRYAAGEFSSEELRAKLLGIGVSTEYADAVVLSAACELEAKGKQATTTQLCAWYDMGTLSPEEYVDRLRAVGWSEEDAIRILRQCSGKVSEKRAREAEKIAAREARAIEKERKAIEREQRKREQSAKQLSRSREIAKHAMERRTKLLGSAAEKLSVAAGVSVDMAGAAIQAKLADLGARYLLTIDQRVQAIVLAVERRKPASIEAFNEAASELAQELDEFGSLV